MYIDLLKVLEMEFYSLKFKILVFIILREKNYHLKMNRAGY